MKAERPGAFAATFAVVACAAAVLARSAAADQPCPAPAAPAPVAIGTAEWNGWGRDIDNSRYQPEPALRASAVPKLELKWAYALAPARSYSQPTVVGGRVFVTSSSGRVYSLDARSGCLYWTFDAAAPVDTVVVVGALGKPVTLRPRWRRWHWQTAHIPVIEPPSAAVFGDAAGNVYALDAERGAPLWRVALGERLHAAVSGAAAAYDGRVYVPLAVHGGEAGMIVALDLTDGALLWQSPLLQAHAAAGGASAIPTSPTIDRRRAALYVAVGDSGAIVALNMADGTLRWIAQAPPPEPPPPEQPPPAPAVTGPARPGAAPVRDAGPPRSADPPILQSLPDGRQVLLTASASGEDYALDPDRGALLWRTTVLAASGGVDWSHAADHRKLYVAAASREPQAGRDNAVLAAIDIATGALRWRQATPQPSCAPSSLCEAVRAHAVTVIPGILFSGSLDGQLRAYSTIDGAAVWSFDTARAIPTLNGGAVRGGALGRNGPTVVDGMAYIDTVARGARVPAAGLVLAFSTVAQ